MLRKIYDKKLETEIKSQKVPEHILVIVSEEEFFENIDKFAEFVKWCKKFSVKEVTIAVNSVPNKDKVEHVTKIFREKIKTKIKILGEEIEYELDGSYPVVNLNFGLKGRREIVNATKELARLVLSGKMDIEEIDEKTIERFLKIQSEPDMIIRAGSETQDFLIWQSIYSEHIFFDTDWKNLRYTDFLRILRDYQRRERRYGR
uniref:Di-trans,poly-cis-decaprenylcistransferase n=1 Tax=Geoglobus ahangari TaxID=113653 RepID=A0A7C4S7X1_9EURY